MTGGDDHALSEHWATSLAGQYPDYRQTARMELTAANRSESYAGIATTFSASIAGSQVVGRSFVRVWSADGAALSVTQVCQQGTFDTTSWDAVVHGITIDDLSGQSRWPERSPEPATPTAPTSGMRGSVHDERPRLTTSHGSCDRSWPSEGSLLRSAESCGPDGVVSAAASDGDCDVAPPAQNWAGSSASARPDGSSCSLSTVGANSRSGFGVYRRAATAASTRNASTSEAVSGSSVRTSHPHSPTTPTGTSHAATWRRRPRNDTHGL